MADKNISELTSLGEAPASDDLFPIWDTSTNTTKKVTTTELLESVSTNIATLQAEVDLIDENLTTHIADLDNPHEVTKAQVGLGSVSNNLQVNQAGDQDVDGIKTFTSSPIVPTPTTGTQAANKDYVDDSILGINKSSVGLFTQGSFIDTFTMDLQINKRQQAQSTATTGLNVGLDRIDTLDGSTFIAGYDERFYEYTKSGTTFTQSDMIAEVTGESCEGSVTKYLSATEAVFVTKDLVDDERVYIAYLQKSGTWSKTNQLTYFLPGYASSSKVWDVWVESATEFYVAIEFSNSGSLRIVRCLIAGGNVVVDGTWTDVVITTGSDIACVSFNSSSEVFITVGTTVSKYSFVSGGTGTLIGNTGTLANNQFRRVADDTLLVNTSNVTYTYEFDGTDYELTSQTAAVASLSVQTMAIVSFTPTASTFEQVDSTFVLTGQGTEDSIEDLSESGHLGYMASSKATSQSGGNDITLVGTVSNDGTYSTVSSAGGTVNKIYLAASTPPVQNEIVNDVVVKNSFADASSIVWMKKGSNYYWANN